MSNQIDLTRLNISNAPFRNRTLPWVVVVIVSFISLVILIYLIADGRSASAQANTEAQRVEKLKKQEKELKDKTTQITEGLTPEQRQLLVSSHELVSRKYFSWSWLFEDLEAVLPSDTKVTRINVKDVRQIDGRTVAELDMSILSKSYVNITTMIAAMDRSGVFQSELTEQNLQKGDEKSMTEWTLSIIYHPRAGVPVAPAAGTQTVAVVRSGSEAGQ